MKVNQIWAGENMGWAVFVWPVVSPLRDPSVAHGCATWAIFGLSRGFLDNE